MCYSMVIDDEKDALSNLRSADVVLIATSMSDMKKMMSELANITAGYGLELNASKMVVLALNSKKLPASIAVGDDSTGALGQEGGARYPGRSLALASLHKAELAKRVGCVRAVFCK